MANVMNIGQAVKVQVFCWDPDAFQVGINTYWVQIDTGSTGSITDVNLAASIFTQLVGLYTHVLSAVAQFVGVQVQPQFTPPTTPAASIATVTLTGTTTNGGPIPDLVSGLVGAKGYLAQKGQNARIYVPFPGTNFLTASGAPTAAYQAALLTLSNAVYQAQTYIGSGYSITTSPIIYHRAQPARISKSKRKNAGKTLPATGTATYLIASNYVGVNWAQQKRRAPRRRTNAFPTLPT